MPCPVPDGFRRGGRCYKRPSSHGHSRMGPHPVLEPLRHHQLQRTVARRDEQGGTGLGGHSHRTADQEALGLPADQAADRGPREPRRWSVFEVVYPRPRHHRRRRVDHPGYPTAARFTIQSHRRGEGQGRMAGGNEGVSENGSKRKGSSGDSRGRNDRTPRLRPTVTPPATSIEIRRAPLGVRGPGGRPIARRRRDLPRRRAQTVGSGWKKSATFRR